jgi:hypothetical protein
MQGHARKSEVKLKIEFLANTKQALAVNEGPRGGLFDEITKGRKSRDTFPIKHYFSVILVYYRYLIKQTHVSKILCLSLQRVFSQPVPLKR